MFDEDLQNAYEKAIYRIFTPPVSWRIGVYQPQMSELIKEMKVQSATFITAYNPGSIILSTIENEERQMQLQQIVEAHGWRYLEGQSEDPNQLWPAEKSLLVFGINDTEAMGLARQFQQNAVVVLDMNAPASLLFTT